MRAENALTRLVTKPARNHNRDKINRGLIFLASIKFLCSANCCCEVANTSNNTNSNNSNYPSEHRNYVQLKGERRSILCTIMLQFISDRCKGKFANLIKQNCRLQGIGTSMNTTPMSQKKVKTHTHTHTHTHLVLIIYGI